MKANTQIKTKVRVLNIPKGTIGYFVGVQSGENIFYFTNGEDINRRHLDFTICETHQCLFLFEKEYEIIDTKYKELNEL